MDKKEEILQAAYHHFSRRGYNVSMSDIAKSVSIKTPSLYSHFSGKDEIIQTLIELEIEKYYGFLREVYQSAEGVSLEQHLEGVFYKITQYFKDNNKLRFWRNILLIDNEALRKDCTKQLFELEMYQVREVEKIFTELGQGFIHNKDAAEGHALLFLAVIQGVLEGELLCYGSEVETDYYIDRTWKCFKGSIFK